jgi:hypothetical protein
MNNTPSTNLLAGCSFTDPLWQNAVPWSVEYSKTYPAYIIAKAGMGIKGICTETLYYLKILPTISKLIIILPTLWRLDVEMDQETYLCNAMVDLIQSDTNGKIVTPAVRKWIISGGLHYSKDTEHALIFDFLYKHQGFLVIAKEHFRALKVLLNYCKERKINYYISAIQDPLDQLTGLDYIREDITKLLNEVEYQSWIRFESNFIDKFLGHAEHPTTEEHRVLCQHILDVTE